MPCHKFAPFFHFPYFENAWQIILCFKMAGIVYPFLFPPCTVSGVLPLFRGVTPYQIEYFPFGMPGDAVGVFLGFHDLGKSHFFSLTLPERT